MKRKETVRFLMMELTDWRRPWRTKKMFKIPHKNFTLIKISRKVLFVLPALDCSPVRYFLEIVQLPSTNYIFGSRHLPFARLTHSPINHSTICTSLVHLFFFVELSFSNPHRPSYYHLDIHTIHSFSYFTISQRDQNKTVDKTVSTDT